MNFLDFIIFLSRRPNWWPRPPDVSDLQAVENLLNSFLVLRLLTRTSAEESQGKLAFALSLSRGSSRNSTKKSAQTQSVSTSSLGKTSEGVTKSGRQQPADYKAWLFTNDWYTQTHSVIDRPERPTSQVSETHSPRLLISSQSEGEFHSSHREKSTSGSGRSSPPTSHRGSERGGKQTKTPNPATGRSLSTTKTSPKYHKPPKATKPSIGMNSSHLDSDSHSIFQDEVYDLMSKDRSELSDSNELNLQLQQESGMFSSTLTDEDEDEILSLGEMKSQHSLPGHGGREIDTKKSTDLPDRAATSHSSLGKKHESLSSEASRREREDDEDFKRVPAASEILSSNNIETQSGIHQESLRSCRLAPVMELMDDPNEGTLQEAPLAAHSHRDTGETLTPSLAPSVSHHSSQVSTVAVTSKKPMSAASRVKKQRLSLQKKSHQQQHQSPQQTSLRTSSSEFLDSNSETKPVTSEGKEERMRIQNSHVLDAIATMVSPSGHTSSTPSRPGKPPHPEQLTLDATVPTIDSSVIKSTTPTGTRKLSLKEIKERRKESLPARLRAAGLDQSFLPKKPSRTSQNLLPAIASTSATTAVSSLPSPTQQPRRSKVTRIKALTRETNVMKLTRRAPSSAEDHQKE